MEDKKEENHEKKSITGFSEEDKKRIISVVVTITVTLVIVALLVITLWGMLNLVLLTFLLTFLFFHLLRVVKKWIGIKINKKIDGIVNSGPILAQDSDFPFLPGLLDKPWATG